MMVYSLISNANPAIILIISVPEHEAGYNSTWCCAMQRYWTYR